MVAAFACANETRHENTNVVVEARTPEFASSRLLCRIGVEVSTEKRPVFQLGFLASLLRSLGGVAA